MADPDGVSVMGYADVPAATAGSALYVLEFEAGHMGAAGAAGPAPGAGAVVYSVWSVAGPCSLVFEAAEGCFGVVDMLGARRPGSVCTEGGHLRVDNATDAPTIVAHV
jgi:hypothetical protein